MGFIYVPAMAALLVKFIVLAHGGRSLAKTCLSRTYLSLLAVMTITNVIELLGYYYGDSLASTLLLLKIYYVALIWLLAFLLQLSWLIIKKTVAYKIGIVNYSASTIVTLLVLFSDLILAGARANGYTVTRIPGDYYVVMQLSLIIMITSAIATTIYGAACGANQFVKIQSIRLLIAIACLALPLLAALAFQLLNINITAAFFLPIGITFSILMLHNTILADELTDIRVYIPFTKLRAIQLKNRKQYVVHVDGTELSAKQKQKINEEVVLTRALEIHKKDNQKEVAEVLKLSESTISKKKKEYKIRL